MRRSTSRERLARAAQLALLVLLSGCVYVTKAEFDEYWDADGDGWPIGEDCNDDHADMYPWAPDWRGDGCDADCGKEPDSDGDDWPDQADCDPNDADAHPCSLAEADGDGTDLDCDGLDGVRTDFCDGDDPDFRDATVPLSPKFCHGDGAEE